MKVCIVGMGEIGSGLYRSMDLFGIDELTGVDINPQRVEDLRKQGINAQTELPLDQDVYILSVLLSEQALDVIVSNNLPEKALVVLESTVAPGTSRAILNAKPKTKLVLFPHRYNPDTADTHGFLNVNENFVRVIGASSKEVEKEAMAFYKRYLDTGFLHVTSLKVAEITKPLENAYRFLEIAIAEELKLLLEEKGFSFDEVRAAVNTKWNTDIKEAKNGIGRHCLPKDIRIMNAFLEGNNFFRNALLVERKYRSYLLSNGIMPEEVTGVAAKARRTGKRIELNPQLSNGRNSAPISTRMKSMDFDN